MNVAVRGMRKCSKGFWLGGAEALGDRYLVIGSLGKRGDFSTWAPGQGSKQSSSQEARTPWGVQILMKGPGLHETSCYSPQECNYHQNDSYVRGTNCIIFTSFPASSSHASPKETPFSVNPEPSLVCNKQWKEVMIGMSRVRVEFLFFRAKKERKLPAWEKNLILKRLSEDGGVRSYLDWISRRDFFFGGGEEDRKLREQKGFIKSSCCFCGGH